MSQKTLKKYYMVSQGSAEIYTDHNSKVSLLMLYATHDVFSEEYDTFCRFVSTEYGYKQVALHQIGNMQLCVVVVTNNNNNNNTTSSTTTTTTAISLEEEEESINDDNDRELEIQQLYSMNTETHAALFRQLCLLHDLVCFRIPVKPNTTLHTMSLNQTQTQRLLHPLVQTMKRMTMTHQSLLVQGIEYVELGTFLRDDVTEAIQKVMKSHRFVLHAVLFVGTKLVTVCSRPRSWVLSPRDLLCLLIYTESVFHVVKAEEEHERQHEQQEQHEQEPHEEPHEEPQHEPHESNHKQEQDDNNGDSLLRDDSDDDPIFESIIHNNDDCSSPVSSSPTHSDSIASDSFHSMHSSSIPPNHKNQQTTTTTTTTTRTTPGEEEEEEEGVVPNDNNDDNDDNDEGMFPEEEEEEEDDLETSFDHGENERKEVPDAIFDNLFFQHPSNKLVQCGVFSKYDRENNITLILIYDPAMEKVAKAAAAAQQQQQQQQQKEKEQREQEQQQQKQQMNNNNEQETEEASSSTANNNNNSNNNNNNNNTPTIVQLEPHKQELILTQQLIFSELRNFVSFLQIKAHAHITMMHYLHYCPGIIHFIFVDRIRNRVIAPRIVSLFSNNNNSNGLSSPSQSQPPPQQQGAATANTITTDATNRRNMEQISVQFLKKKVWEMCHIAQQYRDQGYTEMCLGGLGVQYWFKEWIEDENGNELVFSEKNIVCDPETFANARAHYELYTMYLPFVSTQAIAHYNRILTCVLLDRQMTMMTNSNSSSNSSNGGGGGGSSFRFGQSNTSSFSGY